MSTETDQALQDLIWQRERLNADLSSELDRSSRIAGAVNKLRDLNDMAQSQVVDVLQQIGVWQEPIEQLPPEIPMPKVARQQTPTRAKQFVDEMYSQMPN